MFEGSQLSVLICAILFGLFSVQNSAVANERGLKIEQRDVPSEAIKSTENQYAIVIGINDYLHWPPLEYANADAVAMDEFLTERGFKVVRVSDMAADKNGIIEAIKKLEGKKIHRLLVFFAGHGQTVATPKGEMGVIIPVDGRRNDYDEHSIPLKQLKTIIEGVQANHVLMVFDSCYSGLALTRGGVRDELIRGYLAEVDSMKSVQILTAGRKGDLAQELNGQGLFTRYVIKALAGEADANLDGVVTASEVNSWVRPMVYRQSGKKQLPMYGHMAGEGEFLFASNSIEVKKTHKEQKINWVQTAKIILNDIKKRQQPKTLSLRQTAPLFDRILEMFPQNEIESAKSYILKSMNYGVQPSAHKGLLRQKDNVRVNVKASKKMNQKGEAAYRAYRKTKDQSHLGSAINYFLRSVVENSRNSQAFSNLSLAYSRAKEFRYSVWAGLEAIRNTTKRGTVAASLYNIALSFKSEDQSEQALVFFLAAIDLRKRNSKSYGITLSRIESILN